MRTLLYDAVCVGEGESTRGKRALISLASSSDNYSVQLRKNIFHILWHGNAHRVTTLKLSRAAASSQWWQVLDCIYSVASLLKWLMHKEENARPLMTKPWMFQAPLSTL